MHASNDRDQFAPPRPPGRMRAIALAVLAHAILIGALTWGVNWKTSADQPAVEAELWAAVPQQAAPQAAEPPPPPAPEPPPQPKPVPAPPPPPPAPQRQVQDDAHEADIALQKQKKREELEKKHLAQLEQEKKDKLLREKQEKLEKDKREKEKRDKEKAQREKELHDKQLAEQKKLEQKKLEQEKAEQDKQKKLAEDKRRKADEAREAKEAEARHQANIRRMQGLAGATGGETATGTALRSAGPSGSYGGKVAAKVKPNIVYPDTVDGNPRAEVEVRAAPDGTIVGARILHSSGNKAWDDAVIRALQRTETLPRDVDGRVPASLVIGFRPKD